MNIVNKFVIDGKLAILTDTGRLLVEVGKPEDFEGFEDTIDEETEEEEEVEVEEVEEKKTTKSKKYKMPLEKRKKLIKEVEDNIKTARELADEYGCGTQDIYMIRSKLRKKGAFFTGSLASETPEEEINDPTTDLNSDKFTRVSCSKGHEFNAGKDVDAIDCPVCGERIDVN
jgi:hypothetical protein